MEFTILQNTEVIFSKPCTTQPTNGWLQRTSEALEVEIQPNGKAEGGSDIYSKKLTNALLEDTVLLKEADSIM